MVGRIGYLVSRFGVSGYGYALTIAIPGTLVKAIPGVSYLIFSRAMKASWGISTRPTFFMRRFPLFCLSNSFILRV
jgi:hypothetical protein